MCDDGDFSEVFFQSIILCIAPRQALAEISRSRRFPACLQPWLGLCRANEAHSLWRSPSASTVRQPLGLFAIHDVEGHFIIWKKLTSWKGEKVSWVSSATGFVPSVSYFLCCLAKQKIWKIWFAELLAENHSVYLPKSPDVRKSRGSSSKFLNLASGSLISCQGFFLPMIGLGKNGTEKGRKVRIQRSQPSLNEKLGFQADAPNLWTNSDLIIDLWHFMRLKKVGRLQNLKLHPVTIWEIRNDRLPAIQSWHQVWATSGQRPAEVGQNA